MTFHVLFDARAQWEVEEVVAYLDRVAPEHTSRFLDDLEAVVAQIAEYPLLRPEVRPGVRHESLSIFRYHLWFRVFEEIEHVEVFAVLHHSRDPGEVRARS